MIPQVPTYGTPLVAKGGEYLTRDGMGVAADLPYTTDGDVLIMQFVPGDAERAAIAAGAFVEIALMTKIPMPISVITVDTDDEQVM